MMAQQHRPHPYLSFLGLFDLHHDKQRTRARAKMTIPPVTSQALQRPSGGSQLVSSFPSRFIYLRLLAIVLWFRTVWVAFWGPKKPVDQDNELRGKRPRHVAVVFRPLQHSLSSAYDEDGEYQSWMNSVGNIVEWCLSDGVACLTVFDEKGLLKSHAASLAQIVDKLDFCRESADPPVQAKASIQFLVSGSPIDRTQRERTILDEGIDLDPHGVRRPTDEPQPSTSSNKNSESGRHVDLLVNLISASDGRNSLVRVARTLARQALAASRADNPVHLTADVDLIDKLIKADSPDLNQFPEPELIYVVGCQSNFVEIGNLCPWNIRLSEFCAVQGELSFMGYRRGMKQYASCQQRFGA
ncbi:uncharacterized protein SPPG_01353 [Spizellomyces punctatus DAOM BR117]|uniref:ditrans,polycis-polyprenyl diphosphate synthase [(2E,6E)-farnesyldiphosphate specific] n=1 Tax=Spizellomyces punctatus (strain DAOM BR117) TaxID=645134 RepID=A0A0L0HSL2_SPIPD|nr:uncharacterized protein SPPG_01353 [Spizellomyces punctatus DAOM BR117]KND03900.1 hypothetical protein SPPG_01353 [Spizellomyces punctatus DAOM BR117]|eukprot:XP_016611939.1 hypothetical protein SPPG_01353 [Spizellomyces punctatus DAOM BR117]